MHADREDEDCIFFDMKGEAVVVIDSGFKIIFSLHLFCTKRWVTVIIYKIRELFVSFFLNFRR